MNTLLRLLTLSVIFLGLPGRSSGELDFFAARRDALMQQIPGSLAVLQGAADTRAYVPFRQSNSFYYLTGVEAPGAYLLIDAMARETVLFLPARNRAREAWEGPKMWPGEEAKGATGIGTILESSRLEDEIRKRRDSVRQLYTPFQPEETAATSRDRALQFESAQLRNRWDGRSSREKAFEEALRKATGGSVEIRDLSPILDRMRRVKDAQEIERLREAGRIGAEGMLEAIRSVRPGDYEYRIAAVAEFVFHWRGAQGYAYFPIVGSGPNSCILHYSANARRIGPGDLIVMDFGPDYRYYHSDISRTFPASGHFTEEQAKVYSAVLAAQKAALGRIRPGATFGEINGAAREVLEKLGFGRNWRHGVSHYVGMSTHDVGQTGPLVEGVVLTVEPGAYLPEKELGVRIEDTVLVTSRGYENLTAGVPKEISEIELLMSSTSRPDIPAVLRR